MLPPSINNYTVPGGIKLFFDDGTGERDLGNLVDVEIATSTDELEHFTNRSGKRFRDHVIPLDETFGLNFKLDEPVAEHWQYYFKGGDLELVGDGTDTETDQEVTLTGLVFSSLGQYGISSVTVRQFLDACFHFDGTSTWTDNTTEADSLAGTPFAILSAAADEFYMGKSTPFNQMYFDLQTVGVGLTIAVKYWDGSAWSAVSGLSDGTSNLTGDGVIAWTVPGDWAARSLNSSDQFYFIQITTSAVSTPPTANSIRQNGVQNTDWVLDPGRATDTRLPARIGRLDSAMFADGEEVKVSYTYTTWEQMRFPIATQNFLQGSARLECRPSSGRGLQMDIEIPLCQIKPNGNISLDDTTWLEMPFMLDVLDNTNSTPTYPYGRCILRSES